MIYRATKRYARGTESLIGNFKTLMEARQIIQTNMEDDIAHKVIATYCIYEGIDLVEEFDQTKFAEKPQDKSEQAKGGQSIGSGQRFSPSPLSTRPMPKGMPQPSWKDVDTDKDKK